MPRWSTLVVRTLHHVNRPAGGAGRPYPAYPCSWRLRSPLCLHSLDSPVGARDRVAGRRHVAVAWMDGTGRLVFLGEAGRVAGHASVLAHVDCSFHAHASPLTWPSSSRMWTRFGWARRHLSPPHANVTATCKREEKRITNKKCMLACRARNLFL
jgi:hypothetical protein